MWVKKERSSNPLFKVCFGLGISCFEKKVVACWIKRVQASEPFFK